MKFEQLKHFKELLDKTFISQPDISPKPGQVLSVSDSKEIVWKDTTGVEVEEYATNEEIDLLFGPKLLTEFTFGAIDIVSPNPPPRILMSNGINTSNISSRHAVEEPIYMVPPILPSCFSVKLNDEYIATVDETYFTKYTLKYVINDDYEFILTEADYFGGSGEIEPTIGPNFEQKMIDYNSHIKEGVINNIKIYDIDNTVTSFNSLESVDLNGMHYAIKDILKIDMKALSCQGMFTYIAGDINFDRLDTSMCKNMSYMFAGSKLLPELDLSKLNTSNVTNMSNMFIGSVIPPGLDLSKLNTSNVTDMSYMFTNSFTPTTLDLSSFNTSKVTDMGYMFSDSFIPTLDLSSFNTSNVTDMSNMFSDSSINSLNLSNLNTSNVIYMAGMFDGCNNLASLNLSGFNTTNVVSMHNIFNRCRALTSLDLSTFNTTNVTNMGLVFNDCSSLTSLDLSNFDTSKVENMYSLFGGCSKLTSLNISNFNLVKTTQTENMFLNTTALTRGNIVLTNVSPENITKLEAAGMPKVV